MRTLLVILWLTALAAADPAGDRLRDYLDQGSRTVVVFLGDSVTQGMHLDQPAVDGFPALFSRMLRERWPKADLQTLNLGVPAMATAYGIQIYDDQVKPVGPSLVVLQYGGNDKGTGDGAANLPTYEQTLRQLIDTVRDGGAACLVMTPPMHEPVPDMPYPTAARRVAQAAGVPVADIDTVLKRREVDYRGLFPYFVHPREYEHAAMAVELYRAFCDGIGRPLTLDVRLPEVVSGLAVPGGRVTVPVAVTNYAVGEAAVTVESPDLQMATEPRPVAAGATERWDAELLLPHLLSAGRSMEWPVWVRATSGDQVGFATSRVSVVPLCNVPSLGTQPAAAPYAFLTGAHLSLGATEWQGAADLSATLWLGYDATTLRVRVDVRDNTISGSAAPLGDGIELYLDLRPDATRGKPFHSKQCASLFLSPPPEGTRAKVTTLPSDQPAAGLLQLSADYAVIPGGYRMTLDLPRALLDEVGGRRVTALGFDLAVDDADAAQRKAQLMWLGRADNYVNLRRLGELRLDEPAPAGAVRVTVF